MLRFLLKFKFLLMLRFRLTWRPRFNRAHKLYMALFGEVRGLIKGKHLLIVPSGPLTQLPFQVLVTKAPTSGDHRAAAWLARDHAVTILPAVSSLRALRRIGRPSTAPRPMIGFGNPLLDGPDASYTDVRSSPATSNAAQRRASNELRPVEECYGSKYAAAWPTCRTSGSKLLCPRPPMSCVQWHRM